ncbi:MAG: prenyltransferase [Anaerolineae bacterium]
MAGLRATIAMGRPLFLLGPALPYLLGVVFAWREEGTVDYGLVIVGWLGVAAAQLMTHYVNEYFDAEADRAVTTRTPFSGGSGVLAQDLLPRWVALATGLAWLGIAVGVAMLLHLGLGAGRGVYALFALGILVGWFYSSPPVALASRGLGEVATALVVAILVPVTGHFLQSGGISEVLIAACLPFALLVFAMMLMVHMPDYEADRRWGKRTVVVRLGQARAAALYIALLPLGYLAPLGVMGWGLPPAIVALLFLTLPIALRNFRALRRGDHLRPERIAGLVAGGVALPVSGGLLELGGMLLVP